MSEDDNGNEFIEAFENGRVEAGDFHHRDHVRLAWAYLRRDGLPAALGHFSSALKAFARRNGVPGLYHETITWAYLLVIRERLARGGSALDWQRFADQNGDLFRWPDGVLNDYYSAGLLKSELARQVFVMPDRVPLARGIAGEADGTVGAKESAA